MHTHKDILLIMKGLFVSNLHQGLIGKGIAFNKASYELSTKLDLKFSFLSVSALAFLYASSPLHHGVYTKPYDLQIKYASCLQPTETLNSPNILWNSVGSVIVTYLQLSQSPGQSENMSSGNTLHQHSSEPSSSSREPPGFSK